MNRQQILEEARRLSREEQINLAHELWETESHGGPPLSPELAEELDRRIADDEADTSSGEPWHVLRDRILRGDY